MRKKHSVETKSKAVIEVLRERKTANEVAGEFGVHPAQLSTWKKTVLEGIPSLFACKGDSPKSKNEETIKAQLYQQIGRLQMELEWLKKKHSSLS